MQNDRHSDNNEGRKSRLEEESAFLTTELNANDGETSSF